MFTVFQKIVDVLRCTYGPNPRRRDEVVRFLAQRPVITHEEWHRRFAAEHGIPLNFVCWFRETCSNFFEYDLSAALPEDRLVEDLGMFDATWGDVDWDILEDFESRYGVKIPADDRSSVKTFGQLLSILWLHVRKPTV